MCPVRFHPKQRDDDVPSTNKLFLSRILDVPFPTARLASVALRSLQVDKELSPLVSRTFSISTPTKGSADDNIPEDSVLRVEYQATTNRMLRVAVNSFMESLALVIEVMEHLDTEPLNAELSVATS
jgi:EKC/KEOPS complex subunit PCC1/LAGE3